MEDVNTAEEAWSARRRRPRESRRVATRASLCLSAGDLLPAPINHVLVNEYQPGDGILPHQDGAAYYPAVAIVSLGCDAVMRFAPRRDETSNETKTSNDDGSLRSLRSGSRPFGVFLPRRSLLVFDGALYERYLHGIDAIREDVIDATVANRGDVAANDSSKIRSRSDEDFAAANVDAFPTLRRDRVRVSMTFRNVRVVRAALRLFG